MSNRFLPWQVECFYIQKICSYWAEYLSLTSKFLAEEIWWTDLDPTLVQEKIRVKQYWAEQWKNLKRTWGCIEGWSGVAAKFNRKGLKRRGIFIFFYGVVDHVFKSSMFFESFNQRFRTGIIFGCWIWIGNYSKRKHLDFGFIEVTKRIPNM